MRIRTNPVRSAPSLIHAVALVDETAMKTERRIRSLMRAFPPRLYALAGQLVRAVLKGETYDWAIRQASVHKDAEQKKYALLVLPLLKSFLQSVKPDWVRDLKVDPYQLGVGLQLPVKVHSLMKVGNRIEVLVIHFWAKPISNTQKRAAITIIKSRLAAREELRDAELRWIDLCVPHGMNARQFRTIGWDTFQLMEPAELKAFSDILFEGWQLYLTNPEPPRPRKPRPDPNQPDIFDRPSGPPPA